MGWLWQGSWSPTRHGRCRARGSPHLLALRESPPRGGLRTASSSGRLNKCPRFAFVGDVGSPATWKLPYLLDDGTVGLRRLPMAISAILKTYRGVRFGANLEAATRTFSFAWQGPPLARESCRRPCRMTRPTVTGFSPASWTRRASSRRCGLPAPRRRPSHRRRLEESVSKMSEDESRHGGRLRTAAQPQGAP